MDAKDQKRDTMIGIEALVMSAVIFMMAKKKVSLWTQMTLTGKQSMAWLKPDVEMSVSKMELGLAHQFEERFELPEWAAGSAKPVMVLTDKNPAKWPLFITSQPVIRYLTYFAAEAIKNGAKEGSMDGVIYIELSDESESRFKFLKGKEKFSPYEVIEVPEIVH